MIPNPWDTGTARYLRHLGFKALATTSSGFAFSRGLPDAAWAASRDMVLDHIAEIVAAVEIPINADFQAGYADEPDGVAANVRLCVETGVAGLSIEDATGRREEPLYELTLAVERVKAARAAIDASGADVLLTARAECYLVDHPESSAGVDSSPASVCRGGCGCSLCSGTAHCRRHPGDRKGGQPQAGERVDELEYRAEDCRPGSHGSAAGERRFRIGPDCVDRLYSGRKEDCE